MMSMVLFTEMDQVITGAETVSDLFGYTSEECSGNNFSMLLSPIYRDLTPQIIWECMVNKKPTLVEASHKNGNTFPISLIVTEAQQEINGSSVLIATMFQIQLEYSFITVNKLGKIIATNQRSEKLFEKPLAELSDKHITTVLPALDTLTKGLQKQIIGNGGNGKQLSLWVNVETDSLGISELYNLKIDDLSPDHDMEIVLQVDDTFTITGCSRYFGYHLFGYLNSELVGENIHNLIDAKDLDPKVNLPNDDSNARKRKKTTHNISTIPTISFVSSPARIMVRNKQGFLTPFNMHVSLYNAKTDRFSIYLKPTQSTLCKPPDEVMRQFSDYTLQLQVDNGECGFSTTVFSAVKKVTGETRAIKIINKKLIDENQKQRSINEFKIASSLNHKNIIKYLDQLETENYLCTVMEFGKDGSLEAYTRKKTKLTEEEAHKYFSQLTDALSHLHENKCVHGDIKLNNAVLSDGVVKMIDFNMSKRMGEMDVETTVFKRNTFCGTSLYIAPEMVLNKDYEGEKADLWSLGICLFVMTTGDYPFDSLAASLQNRVTYPSYLSAPCVELIKGILTFDPKKRFSIEQIKNHPWMKRSDQCDFSHAL